ncbi:MAG: hypothetical protein ACRDP6_14875 [Actinoallomurus sp.]
MTAQTREPARTTPRNAQSTGSRHTATNLALQASARLCLAGSTGIAAAGSFHQGWDPGISLAALGLWWLFIGTNGVRAAWGSGR